MKVSVVIPTLNAGGLFKEVLDAVRSQDFPGQVELVIVDSMSDDGTAELARKYSDIFFQVKRKDFNHGQTRNLAIEKSAGELVALLVQDATPADRKWLKKLVDNFQDSKVAGVYSRQVPRPDCRPLIKIRLSGWAAGKQNRQIQEFDPQKSYSPQEMIEAFSFDNVSSMIRREVWQQTRFQTRKFAEDILWARQVLEKGWKIVYEPESVVVHSHNKSLWYEFKRVYLDHQNWWQVGGFRVFNRRIEVLGASFDGTLKAVKSLRPLGLKGPALLGWSLYAPFFVFSQNLAQYMGGWADRWKDKYSCYYQIDQILSRGV